MRVAVIVGDDGKIVQAADAGTEPESHPANPMLGQLRQEKWNAVKVDLFSPERWFGKTVDDVRAYRLRDVPPELKDGNLFGDLIVDHLYSSTSSAVLEAMTHRNVTQTW